jgi:hypothetical protein
MPIEQQTMQPLDTFHFEYGKKALPVRNMHQKAYNKHLPTICYSIFLMNPNHKRHCPMRFSDDIHQNDRDRDHQCPLVNSDHQCPLVNSPEFHHPSIDILFIADSSLRDNKDDVFAWSAKHFDLDICANTVGTRGRVCSAKPDSIIERSAVLRLDQYCVDIRGKHLLKRVLEDGEPAENMMYSHTFTTPSTQFHNQYRTLNSPPSAYIGSGRINCQCGNIVPHRIDKYSNRGFSLQIRRESFEPECTIPPFISTAHQHHNPSPRTKRRRRLLPELQHHNPSPRTKRRRLLPGLV